MVFLLNQPRRLATSSVEVPEDSTLLDLQDSLTQGAYLQRQGRLQDAASVFARIGSDPSANDQRLAPEASEILQGSIPIMRRAEERLLAIEGRSGWTWDRAEFLADQFVDRVMDPVMLGAMVGAGMTYRVSQATLASGAVRLGLPARVIGPATSLLAFCGEATAFPAFLRMGSHLMGQGVNSAAGAWRHEVASSFMVLGGLKLFGFMGNQAVRNLLPASGSSGLRILIPQLAMYLGILAGHQGEQWTGLMESQGLGQLAMESLVTLAHFNGAGRILPHLTGGSRPISESAGTARMTWSGRELNDLVWQVQELGMGKPPGLRCRDRRSRQIQDPFVLMENSNGEGGGGIAEVFSPEISQQVRSLGAQYLGDLLLDKGPILWFVPAEAAHALGITEGVKRNLALSGVLFKEGVVDQVVFNFVYGGTDGLGLPTRLDYAFDLAEVMEKGFLIQNSSGNYSVNPQHRFFQMVWDYQLTPDPHAPTAEILRQRSRTFMTSDVEAGDPSTPPPPPPPVVDARHYPELPFSLEARVSAYPLFSRQEPTAIRAIQMGPVKNGEESLVWIQLEAEPGVAGDHSSIVPRPRYVLLTVTDAQHLGILEIVGEEFQLSSNFNRLFFQEKARPQPSSDRASIQPHFLDETTTAMIRANGFPAIRETSIDSLQEPVYLMSPELAESTGAGEQVAWEFELTNVVPATEGLPEQVVLRFRGNKNYQAGQAIWFTTLTLSSEAAIRLRLISPTREGAWRTHPDPWPIQLVAEHQLNSPLEIEVTTEPVGTLDFTGRLRVLTSINDLSEPERASAVRIPMGRFTLGRLDQGERTAVLFSFFLPEHLESVAFLPLRGGRGFSLSAQDALDLFLVNPSDGRGFELNPDISEVWVVPEAAASE